MGDEMSSEDDLASRALAAAVTARQEMEERRQRREEAQLERQRREQEYLHELAVVAASAVKEVLGYWVPPDQWKVSRRHDDDGSIRVAETTVLGVEVTAWAPYSWRLKDKGEPLPASHVHVRSGGSLMMLTLATFGLALEELREQETQ
jgi:hypothetical protein